MSPPKWTVMRMTDPFCRFYDVPLGVYELTDADSYDKRAEKSLVGNIVCDLQPLDSSLKAKLFGAEESREYKLFCDKNDIVKAGRYVLHGGEWYRIVSAEQWNFGMTAVMRLCADEVIAS